MTPLLSITDLHVSVEDTPIVQGLNLTILEGEVHAIMGPNGSGKSTLVNALMGHPKYQVTSGSVQFKEKDLFAMEVHERSQAGLFLAFQYPKEIAGVTLRSFLLAAHRAHAAVDPAVKRMSPLQFQGHLTHLMAGLQMDSAFAERYINKGFSGGEKKKAEILQMAVLRPSLALMDETDSGLDVDALKIVAEGVNRLRGQEAVSFENGSESRSSLRLGSGQAALAARSFSALIVTHYARILEYITPDYVHVMINGQIVQSGGPEFAKKLEKEGYVQFGVTE